MCKTWRMGGVTFFGRRFGKQTGYPTQCALDAGDSAAISSSFLRLSLFRSDGVSPSAPARVPHREHAGFTQTVGAPLA